jgi:hypothetical protein
MLSFFFLENLIHSDIFAKFLYEVTNKLATVMFGAGRHNLTGDECRSEARFTDTIGIFPEFLDGYNILILPTTGRYFQV